MADLNLFPFASVSNAYVLYGLVNKDKGTKKLPLKDYIVQLVEFLKYGDDCLEEEEEDHGSRCKHGRNERAASTGHVSRSDERGQCIVC